MEAEASHYTAQLGRFGIDWAEVEWLEQSEDQPTLVGAWLFRPSPLSAEEAPTEPGVRWRPLAEPTRLPAPKPLFLPHQLGLWIGLGALTVSLWSGLMLASMMGLVLFTLL